MLAGTNISTTLVANTLGVSNHNVGYLCTKASIGGENNYAFAISENGYDNTDGYLLTGAKPLYNIYSTGAPAKWIKPTNPADYVYYQLLKDGNSKYMFSLGGFRNYNLLANAPFLGGYSIDSETNSSVSSETYNAEIWGNVGSYDWSTIGSADGLKLTVWDGTYKKGESTVIPLQLDTDVLFSSVPITIDRRYALNKNFNVFISLMEGQFLEVGRLPITNTIAVNISTTPTQHSNVFNINLPISLTDGVWSSSDIKGSFFRTYVQTYESTFEPINLSYVYCVLYDKNNSAIRVETITSFDSNFAPLSITKVRANIPLTFKATSNLNANTQIGEWLEITMQYDY